MKIIITSLFLLTSASVFASTTNTSESSSASGSAAVNAGNAQSITYNTTNPGTIAYSGSYTAKTTGAAILPGFAGSFSSDYCGGTAGIAGGGIGFAFSAGAPKIDNSCVMLRTFERTQQAAATIAAIDPIQAKAIRMVSLEILAETDPKVKEIFQKRNLIPTDPVEVK